MDWSDKILAALQADREVRVENMINVPVQRQLMLRKIGLEAVDRQESVQKSTGLVLVQADEIIAKLNKALLFNPKKV